MIEAENLIKRTRLFSDLDERSSKELAQICKTLVYNRKEVVVWEEEKSRGIYLVESGWLKAIRNPNHQREVILNYFGPCDSFNVIAVLSDELTHVRIVTLEKSKLLYFPRGEFLLFLEKSPKVLLHLIRRLAQSHSHLIQMIEEISTGTIESRLAKYILANAVNGVYVRKEWETQESIASRIGTVLDVLNRVLRKFEKGKIISVSREAIIVLKEDALLAISNSESDSILD